MTPTINCSVSNVTTNSALVNVNVTNVGSSGVSYYTMWIKPYGASDWSWSGTTTTNSTNVTINSSDFCTLSPGTKYQYAVRCASNNGLFTDWNGQFTTKGNIVAPRVEIVGSQRNGWYNANMKIHIYDPNKNNDTSVGSIAYEFNGPNGMESGIGEGLDFYFKPTQSGDVTFSASSISQDGSISKISDTISFKVDIEPPNIYKVTTVSDGESGREVRIQCEDKVSGWDGSWSWSLYDEDNDGDEENSADETNYDDAVFDVLYEDNHYSVYISARDLAGNWCYRSIDPLMKWDNSMVFKWKIYTLETEYFYTVHKNWNPLSDTFMMDTRPGVGVYYAKIYPEDFSTGKYGLATSVTISDDYGIKVPGNWNYLQEITVSNSR